jgi:hypothetical protein
LAAFVVPSSIQALLVDGPRRRGQLTEKIGCVSQTLREWVKKVEVTLMRQASAANHDIAALEPALARRSKGRNMTYDVVIVGGGAAGIATASSILKRNSKVTIAVIDPAKDHYYQPGWTLVGAGVFTSEQTRKDEADVIPSGVEWMRVPAVPRRFQGRAAVRGREGPCPGVGGGVLGQDRQ